MGILSRKYFSIRGKEIKIRIREPYENGNGKYTGTIELCFSGKIESIMVDTGPIYSTREEAFKQMEEIVADIGDRRE
jgi:hypothetical protein